LPVSVNCSRTTRSSWFSDHDDGDEIEYGLDVILDGLERRQRAMGES
jgi:hypothetical protein